MCARDSKIQLIEGVLQGMIEHGDVSIHEISIALNNVCAHGECFGGDSGDFTDKQLARLFRGIDGLNKAAKEAEL